MHWTALRVPVYATMLHGTPYNVQPGDARDARPILHMINTTANRVPVSAANIKWYTECMKVRRGADGGETASSIANASEQEEEEYDRGTGSRMWARFCLKITS